LGTLLYASGQKTAAVEAIRAGLQIDPLSAVLYYDLGLILQEQGDAQGAANALALAARLDPKVAAKIGR
jgi:Flp pilus assembly protein TadD